MKIAQIGSFPLDIENIKGGVESSVYGLSQSLMRDLNYEVYVFDTPRNYISENKTENVDGMFVYRYSAGDSKNNFEISKRTDEIINDILSVNPDVCHIHSTGYLQKNIFKILSDKGLKCIVTVHGLQNIEKKNELIKNFSLKSLFKYVFLSRAEFYIINKSNKIIVDTEYVRNEILRYKKRLKISRVPEMHVIPQGINNVFFTKNNNNSESNIIICVGSICKRKGQKQLIESFIRVKENVKQAKLLIAGYVSDEHYFNDIKLLIQENNLENDVDFRLNKTVNEIADLYQNSKIFALHTEEESQGIVFGEAMAVGLPIVSTQVGGVPYIVRNNKNGLLCNYNEIEDFTTNLISLYNDKTLYDTLRSNNKKDSSEYNWMVISKKIEELYKSL